jgi:hypothetical protein
MAEERLGLDAARRIMVEALGVPAAAGTVS